MSQKFSAINQALAVIESSSDPNVWKKLRELVNSKQENRYGLIELINQREILLHLRIWMQHSQSYKELKENIIKLGNNAIQEDGKTNPLEIFEKTKESLEQALNFVDQKGKTKNTNDIKRWKKDVENQIELFSQIISKPSADSSRSGGSWWSRLPIPLRLFGGKDEPKPVELDYETTFKQVNKELEELNSKINRELVGAANTKAYEEVDLYIKIIKDYSKTFNKNNSLDLQPLQKLILQLSQVEEIQRTKRILEKIDLLNQNLQSINSKTDKIIRLQKDVSNW